MRGIKEEEEFMFHADAHQGKNLSLSAHSGLRDLPGLDQYFPEILLVSSRWFCTC